MEILVDTLKTSQLIDFSVQELSGQLKRTLLDARFYRQIPRRVSRISKSTETGDAHSIRRVCAPDRKTKSGRELSHSVEGHSRGSPTECPQARSKDKDVGAPQPPQHLA